MEDKTDTMQEEAVATFTVAEMRTAAKVLRFICDEGDIMAQQMPWVKRLWWNFTRNTEELRRKSAIIESIADRWEAEESFEKSESANKPVSTEHDLTASETGLASAMYTAYCAAVGGVAYNGDPLPTWQEFSADPGKQKQVSGWRAAARVSQASDQGTS